MNTIDEIKRPIAEEFAQFEQAFREALRTDNPLLAEALEHVLRRRGKQLRPLMVLLSAKMCHGVNEKTIQTAVALELLHTASLIHDDVVDGSDTRRGAPSVNALWGNKVAVLVGDFLLARVIEITANLRNVKILNIVADMGRTLSSGELLQLHANRSMWISEDDYIRVIDQKTAALFAACTQAGAASSGATLKQETSLRHFGRELGLIFQMKDDVLDYSEQEIGKPTLSDILDGKATLPLIIALKRAPKAEADEIRQLAEELPHTTHQAENLQRIQSFVLKYDGIRYSEQQMMIHKKTATEQLASFHDQSVKSALLQLLQYTIIRSY
ncbi:MAG: polyprenyl synthetase family protein [Bacteroidales bacterium]|nr:polyprenyl synthetase family protein [Candidatus Colicola faecequi]